MENYIISCMVKYMGLSIENAQRVYKVYKGQNELYILVNQIESIKNKFDN